jgi:hypothetical protein
MRDSLNIAGWILVAVLVIVFVVFINSGTTKADTNGPPITPVPSVILLPSIEPTPTLVVTPLPASMAPSLVPTIVPTVSPVPSPIIVQPVTKATDNTEVLKDLLLVFFGMILGASLFVGHNHRRHRRHGRD